MFARARRYRDRHAVDRCWSGRDAQLRRHSRAAIRIVSGRTSFACSCSTEGPSQWLDGRRAPAARGGGPVTYGSRTDAAPRAGNVYSPALAWLRGQTDRRAALLKACWHTAPRPECADHYERMMMSYIGTRRKARSSRSRAAPATARSTRSGWRARRHRRWRLRRRRRQSLERGRR